MPMQPDLPPRKRCRGNLKAAPIFLSTATVGKVVELAHGKHVARVPILPMQLADEVPGEPAANPLHEPAPDAPVSPDWPDAPLPEEFGEPALIGIDTSGAHQDKHVVAVCETAQVSPARLRWKPEAETPAAPENRIDLIRRAARSLALREERKPRPLPGARNVKEAAIPPMPFEARRQALEAAIRFLARRGVLVTVLDRQAQVRRYRVTGKRENKLAEEVIELALDAGMPQP